MLRILRRYNKWILAVGGTLLLIAFLIPEAIQRLSQQSAFMGGTWARTNDGEVTGADELRLRDEMRVIGMFGDESIGVTGVSRDPVHWYLLQHEAVRAGLVGGHSDGFRALQQMAQLDETAPPPEDMLVMFAQSAQVPTTVVLETLAKLNGVQRLLALFERSAKLSERRVLAAAQEMLVTVDADLVVIDARRLSESSDYAPTEGELAAHLEEFGGAQPGSGRFGFGYRLPNRVRIEWLTVSGNSIREAVTSSDHLSNIELRKHRQRHLDLFPALPPVEGAGEGTADSDDFERVRDQVREHLLAQLAEERTAEIAKFITDQLALPQRGVQRDGPFLVIPDNWESRRGGFEQLAQAIVDQFRVELPVYRSSGPTMIEPARLDTMPDLGAATTTRFGATPLRAAELVAQARELGGSDIFAVQVGVALPVLRSPSSDLVVLRILDADAARPPHSVDEVRDTLIADVRAMRTYEGLVERLDSLRADALRDGLVPLARSFDTTVQSAPRIRAADPQFLQFGMRLTPSIPGLGQSEAAVEEIIRAALALPVDVPLGQVSDERRTIAFGVESRLSAVVARLTGMTPLTSEDFEPMREQGTIERTLMGDEIDGLRERMFSREALVNRNGFQMMRETTEEDDLDDELNDGSEGELPGATASR